MSEAQERYRERKRKNRERARRKKKQQATELAERSAEIWKKRRQK